MLRTPFPRFNVGCTKWVLRHLDKFWDMLHFWWWMIWYHQSPIMLALYPLVCIQHWTGGRGMRNSHFSLRERRKNKTWCSNMCSTFAHKDYLIIRRVYHVCSLCLDFYIISKFPDFLFLLIFSIIFRLFVYNFSIF